MAVLFRSSVIFRATVSLNRKRLGCFQTICPPSSGWIQSGRLPASIEESKNISYKALTQTLIKIRAKKTDGEWVVCPIKKSAQRVYGKVQFNKGFFVNHGHFDKCGLHPPGSVFSQSLFSFLPQSYTVLPYPLSGHPSGVFQALSGS